jgi:hypothetical protein
MNPLITPNLDIAALESRGVFTRAWYIFLNSISEAVNYLLALDFVQGGTNLTNVGRIPKVSAAATLTESALIDSGTDIQSTENIGINHAPGVASTAGRGYMTVGGATLAGVCELVTAEADADGNTIGVLQFSDIHKAAGGKEVAVIAVDQEGATAGNRGSRIRFRTKPNGGAITEAARLDSAGNFGFGGNVAPAYPVDATGDINASVKYRVGGTAGLTVVITTAKLTALGANGSMTFTGGILTAQVAAT